MPENPPSSTRIPQSKTALFDLDGTLLDTLGDIAAAANGMLAELGFPTHSTPTYAEIIGDGMDMLVSRALPESERAPETVARHTARYRELYAVAWNVHTAPYPGIPELLESLAHDGWTLGVVSNKPHPLTELCISHYFPGRFACVLGQRDHVPRKPDPAPLVEAAQFLGSDPANCVYVGDSGVDIESALRAHIAPIGVLWGFRPKSELESAGAIRFAHDAPSLLSEICRTFSG